MVLNSVLMRVDFPKPDSPVKPLQANNATVSCRNLKKTPRERGPTDDHSGELESLPYALPVDLVGQIGETDVAHQFFADDRRQASRGWCRC